MPIGKVVGQSDHHMILRVMVGDQEHDVQVPRLYLQQKDARTFSLDKELPEEFLHVFSATSLHEDLPEETPRDVFFDEELLEKIRRHENFNR